MKKDIILIPDSPGPVTFSVRGAGEDSGLLLLQRLYILLLSGSGESYREGGAPVDLLSFIEGANLPTDDAMNSLMTALCAYALRLLDEDDRDRVQNLTGRFSGGVLEFTLTLKDGTTIKGLLGNG